MSNHAEMLYDAKVKVILMQCPDFEQQCTKLLREKHGQFFDPFTFKKYNHLALRRAIKLVFNEEQDSIFDAKADILLDIEKYPLSTKYRVLFTDIGKDGMSRLDTNDFNEAMHLTKPQRNRIYCVVADAQLNIHHLFERKGMFAY